MLFFTALQAFALEAFAVPGPSQGFQDWLQSAAESEELRILWWGTVDLDWDGKGDEFVARLCDARPAAEGPSAASPWLIYEADGQRWVVERQAPSTEAVDWCRSQPSSPPGFISDHTIPNRDSIELGDDEVRHNYWSAYLEPVEGRLELTRITRGTATAFPSGSRTQNWLRRVITRTEVEWLPHDASEDHEGYVVHANEAAMIVVGPDSTERPTVNKILSGPDAHDGPADASLSVVAVEPSPDQVDIILRITDDDHTSKDQLELWWCLYDAACSSESDSLRRLIITWPDEQGLVATLQASAHQENARSDVSIDMRCALTVFQKARGALTVRLAHDCLGITRPHDWSRPFAVLYIDADSTTGHPTRIATSDLERSALEPHRPPHFGELVRYPDLHPFPTHAEVFRYNSGVTGIRSLEPGNPPIRSAR